MSDLTHRLRTLAESERGLLDDEREIMVEAADKIDQLGRLCTLCSGMGWYVHRSGPDDNVEQVQCECTL